MHAMQRRSFLQLALAALPSSLLAQTPIADFVFAFLSCVLVLCESSA